MRIMSLLSLAIAGGLSFVAVAVKDNGVAAAYDLVLLFVVGAFAPKLLQRAVEKNWNPASTGADPSAIHTPNWEPESTQPTKLVAGSFLLTSSRRDRCTELRRRGRPSTPTFPTKGANYAKQRLHPPPRSATHSRYGSPEIQSSPTPFDISSKPESRSVSGNTCSLNPSTIRMSFRGTKSSSGSE